MRSTRVLLLSGLLMLPCVLLAQDAEGSFEAAPIDLGGFENQGSASVGYRFTDVKGYEPMYREMFGLESGPRLMDFSLMGEAKPGINAFADNYSLNLSGLGGDPFPTAQLTVSKHKLFDLRANWRQAYYFWNQNDNVILPITSVAPTLSTGLTDHHDWDTVRKFGSVDLTLHASDRLRFNFDYYRTTTRARRSPRSRRTFWVHQVIGAPTRGRIRFICLPRSAMRPTALLAELITPSTHGAFITRLDTRLSIRT